MSPTDWIDFTATHPLVSAGLFVLAIVVLSAVRLLLRRTRMGNRLNSPVTLIRVGLVFGALAVLGPSDGDATLVRYAHAAFVAAVLIGTVRVAIIVFVDFYLRERQGAAVSSIVRDVASILTYFLIILLVLRYTLDINLASLIATSAVLTAIIGLALQDVLGAVISGLVLEVEAPFGPGDWMKVGSFEGQVVETGWRTTRIRTRVNEVVTLPNTYLAREPMVNYSRPDPNYGDTLLVDAAYEIAPGDVKRTAFSVLNEEPAVLRDPPAEVWTLRYKDFSIEYAIRYWIDQFGELDRIRDRIMTNIWYAFRRDGIRIPFPVRESVLVREPPRPRLELGDVLATLKGVSLLAPLSEQCFATLAAQARRLIFGRGELIVREGDPGSSFYVIEHGHVAVVIGRNDGSAGRTIAEIGPGDFFGEMSLLAGEKRTATVVALDDVAVLEVSSAAFHQILVSNPAILEPICQLATHRGEQQREHRKAGQAMPVFAADPAAQRLMMRIKSFFRI
jgi:small-conductance mechanosensitive channel